MIPSISPAFHALLGEVEPSKMAFKQGNNVLTCAQMQQELQAGSPIAMHYAHTIMEQLLTMMRRNQTVPADVSFVPPCIAAPLQCVIEQYKAMPENTVVFKTMSKYYTAHEMATRLEQLDSEARSYLSYFLRIARNIVALRSEDQPEHKHEHH